MGAKRCTYQPFCRRSGLNSSSGSVPACQRVSWSRYWSARRPARTGGQSRSIGTSWVRQSSWAKNQIAISFDAGIGQQHRESRANQALGGVAHQPSAQPDAGQRAGEQLGQQRPVHRAQARVAQAGHQRERHGVSNVGCHDAWQRQQRETATGAQTRQWRPAPTEVSVTRVPITAPNSTGRLQWRACVARFKLAVSQSGGAAVCRVRPCRAWPAAVSSSATPRVQSS